MTNRPTFPQNHKIMFDTCTMKNIVRKCKMILDKNCCDKTEEKN